MKEFFSVIEVAKLLKLSRSSILYYIKAGKLKATRVGKIYIISQEDFGEFLQDHKSKKKKKRQKEATFDFKG
jgi:excisionase family DNA binding protein